MKQNEMSEIIEERFKIIDKLLHKIIREFAAADIHGFRVEVKKLRAFLRLLDIEKTMNKPLIPKLLKTFYGYVGIIHNIQMHKHSLFKYITDYKIAQPETYMQLLFVEEDYWKREAAELMEGDSFRNDEDKILKQLPDKLEKSTIKNFMQNNLGELKNQMENIPDDVAVHNTRKILKDILYNWNYIDHNDLPKKISEEKDLKLLAAQLENFRDKCIQLEFLSDEYFNKVKDENEKNILLKIKTQFLGEKQIMIEKLTYSLNDLREQLIDYADNYNHNF